PGWFIKRCNNFTRVLEPNNLSIISPTFFVHLVAIYDTTIGVVVTRKVSNVICSDGFRPGSIRVSTPYLSRLADVVHKLVTHFSEYRPTDLRYIYKHHQG